MTEYKKIYDQLDELYDFIINDTRKSTVEFKFLGQPKEYEDLIATKHAIAQTYCALMSSIRGHLNLEEKISTPLKGVIPLD